MRRLLKMLSSVAVGAVMLVALAAPSKAEPVEIRMAYGGVPGVISPLPFLKPEILGHDGKLGQQRPSTCGLPLSRICGSDPWPTVSTDGSRGLLSRAAGVAPA